MNPSFSPVNITGPQVMFDIVHLPSASVEVPLPLVEFGVTFARGSGCPFKPLTTVPDAAQSAGSSCCGGAAPPGEGRRTAGICADSGMAITRQTIQARIGLIDILAGFRIACYPCVFC